MDEMMKVPIFQPSEKRKMLEDEKRSFLDPNLVMDARHRIFRENLYSLPARKLMLTDTKKYVLHQFSIQFTNTNKICNLFANYSLLYLLS